MEANTEVKKTKSQRNKILLINPQYHRNWQFGVDSFSFPIGLMYLGTVLEKAGFQAIIIDTCVQADYRKIIADNLPEAVFAGFSVITPQVPHALEMAREIRDLSPDTPLVWGGIAVVG